MNILLIGNGFDLAHGLPTRYSDFINFLNILPNPFLEQGADAEKIVQDRLKSFDTFYLKNLKPEEKAKLSLIWNVILKDDVLFKEICDTVKANFWARYLMTKHWNQSNEKWVDLERDIGEVIQYLENDSKQLPTHLEDSLKDLYDVMPGKEKRYPRDAKQTRDIQKSLGSNLVTRLYDDLLRLTRCFEIYLAVCMKNLNSFVTKRVKGLDGALGIDRVLSFNYTDTVRRLYFPDWPETSFCYIHGKAELKNDETRRNRMVIGMDEYLPEDERNETTDYIMFRKYYQRIFNKTDYNYTAWLRESKRLFRRGSGPHSLHIIGHSLSKTDEDVLRELILHENVTTTVYYRDKISNGRQIQSLIQRLGYENLNRLARGSDTEGRLIKFKPLEMEDVPQKA